MNVKKNYLTIIPFIILFFLFLLLGYELFFSKPNELPSALLNEKVPEFKLPNLFPSQPEFTHKALTGRIILLNIWATWCTACSSEHEMLMKIKNTYRIPIYGIDYKDTNSDAIQWLNENGNPYVLIGDDANGDAAIDLGVYGTPETFVINAQGKIIYKQIGAINQKIWDDVLYPIIKNAENNE